MDSPFLYFIDDRLSGAELSAARLDGDVFEVGDAYIPADAVETVALRAGSLRGTLGESLAATHVTAAWIHGALDDPPARHTVQRAVARRLPAVFGVRLIYRDPAVEIDDLMLVGGVCVTTPARTLADLVRVSDELHERAATALARARPTVCDEAIAWLDAHRSVPFKRRGKTALTALRAEMRPVRTR